MSATSVCHAQKLRTKKLKRSLAQEHGRRPSGLDATPACLPMAVLVGTHEGVRAREPRLSLSQLRQTAKSTGSAIPRRKRISTLPTGGEKPLRCLGAYIGTPGRAHHDWFQLSSFENKRHANFEKTCRISLDIRSCRFRIHPIIRNCPLRLDSITFPSDKFRRANQQRKWIAAGTISNVAGSRPGASPSTSSSTSPAPSTGKAVMRRPRTIVTCSFATCSPR